MIPNIKNLIEKLSQSLQKRREREILLDERRRAVSCPHCGKEHNSSFYISNKTLQKDIDIRTKVKDININFLNCSNCEALFGVKSERYVGTICGGGATYRNGFSLEDIGNRTNSSNKKNKIFINMVKDFCSVGGSGPRYISEGDNSGEEFRESLLVPKLKEAILKNKKLVVNLDGTFGYGVGFLEEAFGGIIKYHDISIAEVRKHLYIISNEEPGLKSEIMSHCKESKRNKNVN